MAGLRRGVGRLVGCALACTFALAVACESDSGQPAIQRTDPVLVADAGDPAPCATLPENPGAWLDLSVVFRSDDAGEPLAAIVVLDPDADAGDPRMIDSELVPPGTADADRTVALHVQVPSDVDGCHVLALYLVHQSHVVHLDYSVDTPLVSWWVAVGSGAPASCGEC